MAEPGHVRQGPFLKRIDAVANDPSRRDAFLEALKNSRQDQAQILIDYGIVNAAEAAYLRRTWFDPDWERPNSTCWWPEHQPLEPIIRQSLIKAIEVATRPPEGNMPARILPITSYWVYGGDHFESTVCLSDHQVTRMTLAPPVPQNEYTRQRHPKEVAKLTAAGSIWIIKHDSAVAPWEIEEKKDIKNQVVTVRQKELP